MKKGFLIAIILFCLTLTSSVPAQTPRQEQLLNGLKLVMLSDAKANNVTVRIRIHGGSAFDPQGKEGVMMMLAENLFPNEASREFFAEDLGGSLKVDTTYDYIQITASSSPENEKFVSMIETLASAVATPVIDKETTAKLRAAQLAKLKTLESDPAYVADQAVAKRLFGTFPYGRPQIGTADSLQKIDFADLIDARQRFLTADNATVTISGNFNNGYGFRAVRRLFGAWLKSDRRVPSSFRQPDAPPAGLLTIASPKPDAGAVRAAFRGSARGTKDFVAARVFANILASRMKARIPAENAASVFVHENSYVQPGLITIGFAAAKNDVGTGNGKIEANDLIAKALADPITESEFQTARQAVAGEWQKRAVEEFWLDADTYKIASIDADRTAFDKVTLADIRSFAEKAQKSPIAMVLVNNPAS